MVCVIFIPVLYIIMISFKIQAQAIASHAFVIPFNAGHGANSDSVSMPPCDFPFPLIYYSVLSAYKIPASVGCKSAAGMRREEHSTDGKCGKKRGFGCLVVLGLVVHFGFPP